MTSPLPGVRSGAPSHALLRAAPRRTTALLLAAVLLLTGLVVAERADAGSAAVDGAQAAAARTWVVDAVDDDAGNRWQSVDTGTSDVTIAVGDTVEWQFDVALQNHDLTSEDTRNPWRPPVAHFAAPGSQPFRYTFDEPGLYVYLCSVHGTTMRGSVLVEAAGATNRPPTADPTLSPSAGAPPLVVHAEAAATDPDGDTLSYLWDFGTAGDASDQATTSHAMFSYARTGTFTAHLTVSDGRGGTVERDFPVTVGVDGAPAVTATADTTSGPAPLVVSFRGAATDAEGGALGYAWDFGVPGTSDTASGPDASFTYTAPGTYAATLTVTDSEGHAGTDVVDVVVTDPDDPQLPAVTATATPTTPTTGTAPLSVALSAETTTTGRFASFADGTTTYPDLTGTATLLRRAGATRGSIDVTGLAPGAAHLVHVHERPCATENGGAHFRFDRSRPFTEANEIWMPFTSDAQGRSGRIEVTQPQRADETAVSVVIHDPANPARRIGCADLAPSTAGLVYSWDLGDGSTAQGSDPVHVYQRPGTYTARVTVGGEHAGHGSSHGPTVTAAVEVVVPDATPPAVPPAGPPAAPVARVIDATAPAIRATRPSGVTRDRRPTLRASVIDDVSATRRRDVRMRVDGRRVTGLRLDTARQRISWTPQGPLALGRHTVRVVAVDAVGNRATRTWRFRVVR